MRAFLAFMFLTLGICTTTARAEEPLQLVVMDPLSQPLSCDCVKGYAQRKYELLADYLGKQLGQKVQVTWHESLAEAVKETDGKFDLVIGKHSVVLFDAKKMKTKVTPVARLTGRKGAVVQQGLVVVRSDDAAKTVEDLSGYQIFFGPEEAEEKSSAPLELLTKSGVKIFKESKTFGACSEAAVALMKLPENAKAAAIISSYAEPLLEGCGSIKKGDLRVLAKTKDVPFITAFVRADMPESKRKAIQESLLLVTTEPKLLIGLETLLGFETWQSASSENEPQGDKLGATSSTPAEKKNSLK